MAGPDQLGALRDSHLFGNLNPDELAAVLTCAEEKRFEKGDIVFLDGEAAMAFYVVIRGAIKIFKTSRDAKELILHICESGDSFAEAAAFAGRDYPASAEALADSQVLTFQKARFRQLLEIQPNIALKIIGALSMKLRFMVHLLDDLTLKDVEERLASMLLEHCDRGPGQNVEVPFSKKVLAAKLGTIPETLSRTLRKFKESRMIEVDGLSIKILRPDILRTLLRSGHV